MSEELQKYLKPGDKNLLMVYGLLIAGIVLPVLPFVGGFFAYANKDSKDELLGSHYNFAFRTIWIGLVAIAIASITSFAFIGLIIQPIAIGWVLIRAMFAMKLILEKKPHPKPETIWIN